MSQTSCRRKKHKKLLQKKNIHTHTHTDTDTHTHDSTIYAASKDLTSLLEILKFKLEEATNWFETNHMLANPDKF